MKKSILLILLLFFISGTVSAQKKPVKKPAPKTIVTKKPVKNYPPPPTPKKITETEVIYVGGPSTKDSGAYPTAYVSPEEKKYNSERVCTNCDTLILEAGRSHIVVYDVKWMADDQNKKYNPQPTEYDLRSNNYGLRNLVKREWDELHKNFPEKEVTFHHVYRNTFIKAENSAQEKIDLLDRQERHEGYLYWSGKSADKIFQGKEMVSTTEKISKIRNESKISSYYNAFKKDSLLVENRMKSTTADENVRANLNDFLIKEILSEHILPVQFLDLKNVKSVNLINANGSSLAFAFNKSAQLIEIDLKHGDKHAITYENGLPSKITENSKVVKELAFQGNSLFMKDNYTFETFELSGKIFLKTDQLSISEEHYKNMNLRGETSYEVRSENGQTCEMRNDSFRKSSGICYSNNQWSLPLLVTTFFPNGETVKNFSMNENNELIISAENSHRFEKMIYKIEKGILKNFEYRQKKKDSEENSTSWTVEYEFYE